MKAEITAVALAASLVVGLPDHRAAHAKPADWLTFDEIWAFGDSLSDSGNFFGLSGGQEPPSVLPETEPEVTGYNEGRYTDGFVWVERLGPLVGAQISYNLAIGGAYANENNQFLPLPGEGDFQPGLLGQVEFSDAGAEDLVTIWVGANDYFAWIDPATTIPNACIAAELVPPDDIADCAQLVVGNIVDAITILHDKGARNFLIGNLPDLAANPFAVEVEATSPGFQTLLAGITAAHNQTLAAALAGLREDPLLRDTSFTLVDMFTGFNELATRGGRYGLTDTENPCLFRDITDTTPPITRLVLPDVEAPFTPLFLCPLQDDGTLDSTGFLFWDQIHPSRDAHDLIGIFAFETLRKDLRWPQGMRNREEKITKRALSRLRRYTRSGRPEYEVLEGIPVFAQPPG